MEFILLHFVVTMRRRINQEVNMEVVVLLIRAGFFCSATLLFWLDVFLQEIERF